ncbi:nSTAND1 domain-containing NTPase [Egbenema bharatensis]|uniref:nSTAND1 domain-containing NTPase n=1 Tax=Egbenema bharatensis TaxID=3463334 RepID=UPI003A8AA5C3
MRDALAVGINTYQSLPNLKAPARDAEAIAQHLQTYGEFRVHRLPEVIQVGKPTVGQKTQVTLRELETALIRLFKPKGNSVPQTALFYFSGHGIQRDAGIEEGYLALSDSQPEKGFYGLSLFWLRRLLQESPVRQRIVILDCCHSGELLNFLEADPGARPGTDRLFMAASREYETAFESLDSPYSVFTQAILTGLDPIRTETGIVTNHSLTDHVNHALKGEIQQPLFESSGSEIVLTRRSGLQSSLSPVPPTSDRCPYPGLSFFDESQSEYFFGREDLTSKLIYHLKTDRFVAVVGASGIGKSSLVRAGMIAQLREEKTALGDDRWRIKLITPTAHPLKGLASAFIDPNGTALERAEQLRRVKTFLEEGGSGFAQLIQACLPLETERSNLVGKERPRLLLVIDQFEEVFTLARGVQAEAERQQFFQCLVEAMTVASDSLSVVIVLRSDFLSRCSLHEGLCQKIAAHQLPVTPLKYDQIKATILRPAQKMGLICEPNLVYTMLLDVSGAPGELPLLQYTLMELWQRRQISKEGSAARLTLQAYQELGGIRGTLQTRATEVFHQLTLREQAVAKRIFLSLTQLGEGTEDTRRRVQKSELVSPAYPEDLVDRVLEKLVAAKLIVTHQDVDVIHEALIRNWSLLREWLNESRETLHRLRRVEQAAQEWDAAGQSSKADYLLYGLRLREAEDVLKSHAQELSALAQQLIAASQSETRRTRRESRQLQIAIPSVLLATLTVVFSLYHNAVRSQAEKAEQLQQATSRERAAIAQSILQDVDNDPMTALLISRLAAEEGGASLEAQTSLRSALQNLRLQLELPGHTDAVHQVVFSPDRRYLATAGADGTIRLWLLNPQTVYNARPELARVLRWSTPSSTPSAQPNPANIIEMSFSPDGRYLAAVSQDTPMVQLWSVESGERVRQIPTSAPVTQLAFSPNGVWLATLQSDRSITLWQTDTGLRSAHLSQSASINTIEFSPNGQFLLTASDDRTAQLWQLNFDQARSLELEKIQTLTHSQPVHQATFNASGQRIATSSTDGIARLWDATTGQLLQSFAPSKQAIVQASSTEGTDEVPTHFPSEVDLMASQTTSQTASQTEAASPQRLQVQFSPDQQHLAVADPQHHIWLWDFESGQIRKSVSTVDPLDSALPDADFQLDPLLWSFNPTGHLLVTTSSQEVRSDGLYNVNLWNVQTGERVGVLPGHTAMVETIQFSPDGTYVATASADGRVQLWSAEPGGELPTLTLPRSQIEWAMFIQSDMPQSQTAETLVPHPFGSHSPEEIAWQPGSSSQQQTVLSHPTQLLSFPFAADFSQRDHLQSESLRTTPASRSSLVTVSPDGNLQHWQILTGGGAESTLPPSPQSNHSGDRSFNPSFWQQLAELNPFQEFVPISIETPLPAQSPGIRSTQLPLQLSVATAGENLADGASLLSDSASVQSSLSSVALSPNGQLMAIATPQGLIEIRRTQSDQSSAVIYRIQNWRSSLTQDSRTLSERLPPAVDTQADAPTGGEPVPIRQLVFSPNGRQLMMVANDFTVRLWDVQSGELLHALRGHEATVQQARFSPDGQWVISASWDRSVRIWNVETGELLRAIVHPDVVNSASFSPDHQQVVTAGGDGLARVFNVSTGEQKLLLARHQKAILDAEFSPNGQQIVTAGADGVAYLWAIQTGTAEAELRLPRSMPQTESMPILQASFSPDGQYVATLTKDGRVHLWAATWEMLLKLSRDRSLRQLTPEECNRYLKLAPNDCPMLSLGQGR